MNIKDLDAYVVYRRVMDAPDLSPSRAGAALMPTGKPGRPPFDWGFFAEAFGWLTGFGLIIYFLVRWAMS